LVESGLAELGLAGFSESQFSDFGVADPDFELAGGSLGPVLELPLAGASML